MGAARNTAPKWVDLDLPWGDTDEGAKVKEPVLMAVVDRFHNHEEMSPEAMARAIAELQETVRTLDSRLVGAEADAADVVHANKGLGANMVQMGDALTKRMRALEDSVRAEAEWAKAEAERAADQARKDAIAARKQRTRMMRLSLGLAGAVVAVVASIVLLGPQLAPPRAATPSPVLYTPSAPASTN